MLNNQRSTVLGESGGRKSGLIKAIIWGELRNRFTLTRYRDQAGNCCKLGEL